MIGDESRGLGKCFSLAVAGAAGVGAGFRATAALRASPKRSAYPHGQRPIDSARLRAVLGIRPRGGEGGQGAGLQGLLYCWPVFISSSFAPRDSRLFALQDRQNLFHFGAVPEPLQEEIFFRYSLS
jgi:hypothetical protein